MATQQVNERLAALTAAGTSIWLDQIKRALISTGELQRLVEEDSLRGVTSNPTIFNQAILGSEDYDEQLAELARAGKDNREIYQELAIRDIQDACDVLRVVYDESGGTDGFVSFEVDPDLAFDTQRTIEQAREYWDRVDRPNLMIKIPGTTEGTPAIEEMIYEGRNINVTLLFGVEEYAQVAEAYIRGLERRLEEGKSVDINSVASFFVSRVDSEVDKRLEGTGHDDLLGKAGIANARAAYQRYEQIFLGERFAALLDAGAAVQRPLWASTGVKNPAYRDVMYVEELVGPNTVNTMPMATLLAAGDHAEIRGNTAGEDPPPPEGAGRRRHRHGRRHRPAAARRRGEVRRADGEAAGGHRHQAPGDRHPAPVVDRRLAARRRRAAVAARVAGRAGRRRTADLAQGRRPSGARRARPRSPTAWDG